MVVEACCSLYALTILAWKRMSVSCCLEAVNVARYAGRRGLDLMPPSKFPEAQYSNCYICIANKAQAAKSDTVQKTVRQAKTQRAGNEREMLQGT
jgi:hypothetical protein